MSSRVLGIILIYVFNSKYLLIINDFVVLPRINNYIIILSSSLGLIFNIFILRKIEIEKMENKEIDE